MYFIVIHVQTFNIILCRYFTFNLFFVSKHLPTSIISQTYANDLQTLWLFILSGKLRYCIQMDS